MRTVSEVIQHFGVDEIKGKFLLLRINARGKYLKKRIQTILTVEVMCYQVKKSQRQFYLIAIDTDPQGLGILSLGGGTKVIHLVNGRKKKNGLDGANRSRNQRGINQVPHS